MWDVDALLEDMTWRQFSEWRAYAALDPFEGWRGDYQAAMVVAMLANVNRGKASDPVRSPVDFLPKWGEPAEESKARPMKPETWQAFKAAAKAV